MGKNNVIIFKPYPFAVGQKIFIKKGPRKGDWEVKALATAKLDCVVRFQPKSLNGIVSAILPKSVVTKSGRIETDWALKSHPLSDSWVAI